MCFKGLLTLLDEARLFEEIRPLDKGSVHLPRRLIRCDAPHPMIVCASIVQRVQY